MPYKETWYPKNKKRSDAKIGSTSVWDIVERAKDADVPAVRDWRRNKTIGSAAEELRCYDSVNAINDELRKRIRKSK
jgi:ribosome-associated translation inhibitor RaiA